MSRNPYTIETRAQGALVLSSSKEVSRSIAKELRDRGLEPLENVSLIDEYLADHDLDYIVVVLTPTLQPWIEGEGRALWERLLMEAKGGNMVIAAPSWEKVSLELPEHIRQVSLGEYLEVEGAPTLNQLIEGARRGIITLPGDGIVEYSLLSLADLAMGLVHTVLSPGHSRTPLILANPETVSLLGLAHTIAASLSKHVKIEFGGEVEPPESYAWEAVILEQAKRGIVIAGDTTHELTKYLKAYKEEQVSEGPAREPSRVETKKLTPLREIIAPPPQPVFVARAKTQPTDQSLMFVPIKSDSKLTGLKDGLIAWKNRPRIKAQHPLRNIVIRGLVIALGLYIGSLAFATTVVALSVRSLATVIESGEVTELKVSLITKYAATYLEANLLVIGSLPPLKNNQTMADTNFLIDLYAQGLGILETTTQLSASAQNIASYVLTDKGGDIASYFSSARLYTEELYQRTSLLDGAMGTTTPELIKDHAKEYEQVKVALGLLKKNLITGKALLAVAPDFIALGSRAKYAVLFQNNMELRPTGGFIGSFAILSFENGRLYDMPVYDVYAADGQLKGHVEPPGPIKDILGEANWYRRDSNFDPDFPTSARRAEWFIKKTMNEDVGGTIAITLDLLKSLLHATGPLELPDYQETVSESNIYERSQFHAEVNFFPGSQAKKEFLSSVADALFAKVQSGGTGDTLKLVASLALAVNSKNILISSLDPSVERVFSTLTWNGQLVDHPCPGGGTCVQDYAFLVDSNFGVNKANYYVERSLSMTATADKDGILAHTFSARYKNSATSSAWPAGPYKNYARLYLPFGSQLESVKVGEKTLAPSELTQTEEHGKLVVAFLFTVPINTEVEVVARYKTPQALKAGSLYTWYWQKQPGTNVNEQLAFTLNYPLYLKPEVISPTADLIPQSLRFDFKNDADHRVTVKFAQ